MTNAAEDINPTELDPLRHKTDKEICRYVRLFVAADDDPISDKWDGLYRYQWSTAFGWHSVLFFVKDGLIDKQVDNSPAALFQGRDFREFLKARKATAWRFKGKDRIFKQGEKEGEPTCS